MPTPAKFTTSAFLAAGTEGFLFALQTNGQLQTGNPNLGQQRVATNLNLQLAIDTLRSLGMSGLRIKKLERTGTTASEIQVYSPVAGFVLAWNVSPGQRFEKGSEMYRIAGIGHLWVMTDIFEKDRKFVGPAAPFSAAPSKCSQAVKKCQGRPGTCPTRRASC